MPNCSGLLGVLEPPGGGDLRVPGHLQLDLCAEVVRMRGELVLLLQVLVVVVGHARQRRLQRQEREDIQRRSQ